MQIQDPKEKKYVFLTLKGMYQAEKIIPPPKKRKPVPAPVPAPIKQLRRLQEISRSRFLPTSELFVQQGKMLASYEDDTVYKKPVLHYFPTYRSLSNEELRGYFGLRTRYRHGRPERTSESFAFLYIYELLNGIGVSSPEEGLAKLKEFLVTYGELDAGIRPYLLFWIRDYVVYHQLDPREIPEGVLPPKDPALATILQWEKASDQELFTALDTLSEGRLTYSGMYKHHKEVFVPLLTASFRALLEYYRTHRKKTFVEDYIGAYRYDWIELFGNAVFFREKDERDFTIEVTPLCSYSDRKGIWTIHHYVYSPVKLAKLKKLLKSMDSLIRKGLGMEGLQEDITYKWFQKLVGDITADYVAKKKEAEARVIHLDLSQLKRIRKEADVTKERLMTEEERWEETIETEPERPEPKSPEPKSPEPKMAESKKPESDVGTARPWNLTEPEYRYLQCLLYGKPADWVLQEGLLPSILADAINDKCYEDFGDTVLEVSDHPEVLEDYRDDLKGKVKP